MAQDFARFATTPIGPNLAARDGGLTLTTSAAATLAARARSDAGHVDGVRGVEFTFWGDDALQGAIGVTRETTVNTALGSSANSLAWRLHTGEVWFNGGVVASGLPAVAKGDIVGVRITFGAPHTVQFYKGGALIHTRTVSLADAVYFAASLITTKAEGLVCAVNAGQWQAASAAAAANWPALANTQASAKLSDLDYLSAATDAPAHARYEGLLLEGISTAAEIGFWPWSGDAPVRGGSASARILDPDGVLDAIAQLDLRGTPVAVRLGDLNGTVAASSAIARYVVERIEVQGDNVKQLLLSDAHNDLDRPLTRGVFLPNVPGLAWTPQPVVIGAVASVPALPANSDGTVLFLADAPLASVSSVMDRGDLMEPGTFSLAPDSQQLTMQTPPVGPVVCDVSSIGAGMQPATLVQFLHAVFGRIGKASWSSADAAAIDAATGYAGVGYYTRESGDVASVRQALARVLPSFGAWWWQDDDGTLRFTRIIAPESYVGTLAFDVTRADLMGDLVSTADMAPNLSRRMTYRPNAAALASSDLVTDIVDVPQTRRDELTGLWRGQVYGGGPLPRRYRHADSAEPMQSVLYLAQDAQSEIDRVIAMYESPRSTMVARFSGDPLFAPKPGEVGRITYGRHGLEGGKQVLVRARTRNPATGDVTLILWG